MTEKIYTMAESIDWLFTRLAGTYGAQWTRQWEGTPMSDVKTVWGHELSGYAGNPSAIRHAVQNLPERCPNVIQFRNLCRAAPSPQNERIEPPRAKAENIAAELLRMGGLLETPVIADAKAWARAILARAAAGEKIKPFTLKQAQDALFRKAIPGLS